jgi:uncharacterized RDD family membrane protein YckC
MTVRTPVAPGAAEGPRHAIVTPEGVALSFPIASAGDRAGAFLIDFAVMVAAQVLVFLLLSAAGVGAGWTLALGNVLLFLLQNAYFVWFESRWQGSTPGKRATGIRVIDARGGTLTVDAVVARNLARVLEVFLPLAVVVSPEALWPDAPSWARLAASGWIFVFALLPLFNRERLRVGDLIAGTCVVWAPKAVLLEDQTRARPRLGAAEPPPPSAFTDAQLDVYGIYELQVLEDVLRRSASRGAEDRDAVRAVATKIAQKIRWTAPVTDPGAFLREFYAALRDRLERRMLVGRRKEDKHAR